MPMRSVVEILKECCRQLSYEVGRCAEGRIMPLCFALPRDGRN